MTTLNITLAACLILLAAAAALLTVRAMKMQAEADSQLSELAERHQQLDREEIELQRRYNEISAWEDRQKQDGKRISSAIDKMRHIYYNVSVDDPDGSAPAFPDKKAYKAIKSGIGYRTAVEMKNYIRKEQKSGKAVYSLDIYVIPFKS